MTFYATDWDLMREARNYLAEAVLGRDKPRLLFDYPFNVASDGQGRVFVADHVRHGVQVLDLARHQFRNLLTASGGLQIFRVPAGLAVDEQGRTYVSDSADKSVLVFGPDERFRFAFGKRYLERPFGLALDGARDRIYVVDSGGHRLAVFDTGGRFLRYIGQRGTGPGEFNSPTDVDVDGEGNIFLLDSMNARVQVFDPEGNFLRAFGERGTAVGSFDLPKGIAVDSAGHVYVLDTRGNKFVIFDREGNLLLTVGSKSFAGEKGITPGGFFLPQGIDADQNDAIWIADSMNRTVHQFQYLNRDYLEAHPIRPEEVYVPPQGGAGAVSR